jgi:hypothetical protein
MVDTAMRRQRRGLQAPTAGTLKGGRDELRALVRRWRERGRVGRGV